MATTRPHNSAPDTPHTSPQVLFGRLSEQKQSQPNTLKWRLKLLASCIMLAYGAPSSWAATVNCNTTLYFCSWQPDDIIILTTTEPASLNPLQGYGVYLAGGRQNTVNDITITTSGNASDGIRSTQPGVLFRANRLTIKATGSSADGINLAADTGTNADALIIAKDYADITSSSGVAVRANNFQNANANSVIILPDNTTARATASSASNSSDSVGYALFAGNRDRDTNGIGILGILQGQNNNTLGNSYVFSGANSEISTTGTRAHAAYANKGGLIQLGDGSTITTTGSNAFPLYAATEQQGSYTSNTRPGYIFLEGGVKLRSDKNNKNIAMQANGAGSIIASKAMAVPDITDSFLIQSRIPGLDKSITQSTSGKFDIEGLIDSINGGEISLNMSNGSYFKGSTSIDSTSTINLNIDGQKSTWYIEEQASLSNLTISNDAILLPKRENYEIKKTTLNGNVNNNNGILHLAIQTNGIGTATPGDLFTINGNYSGDNGKIYFDTFLNNDNSPTDLLIINGDTSGNSTVYVNNTGGIGAPTQQGIKIIEVNGQANGTFSLENGYTVLGAYTYRLSKEDTTRSNQEEWFLRSKITPTPPTPEPDPKPPTPNPNPNPNPEPEPNPEYHVGSPAYEAYTQSLLDMNNVGTLQQRVGNRVWLNSNIDSLNSKPADIPGIWTRIETSYTHNEPLTSTTRSDFKQHINKIQLGIDIPINKTPEGTLIAGASLQLAKGSTRTSSKNYGDGHVSTDGYGLKGTLTWYDEQGLYIDTQAQTIWFRTDLKTDTPFAPTLEKNHDGFGYALSAESGKKIAINNQWSTTPQAQLVYSNVDFEHFTDGFGSRLKSKNGESLRARLGTSIDHEATWQMRDGKQHKSHIYGIANLYYELDQGTKVNLSGVDFVSKNDRLWGGLGIGGSYSGVSERYSIYGEALIDTSLNNPGKSYSARADIGLRMRW